MEEIGYGQQQPTQVNEDNEGAIKIAKNPMCHDRLKHIDLKFHMTRDAVEDGSIRVVHISTHNQVADVMTKPLAKRQHWQFTDKLLK
jgi:hypothetical protein